MERYIALLRGINVGGNNKISMPELRQGFEELGYEQVVSHINSGNVLFSTMESPLPELTQQIEDMIQDRFSLRIPVLLLPQSQLVATLKEAPDWWGTSDKEIYDNLIFLYPGLSGEVFSREMGVPHPEYEQVQFYERVVFWSFVRKDHQKTNWWAKTTKASIRQNITIRTANTLRKIATM